MKHIFTFSLFMVAATCGLAQHKSISTARPRPAEKPRVATVEEIERARFEGSQLLQVSASRDVFNEDFSNGFGGQGTNGAWTFEDTGGNTIWMMADANSPAGAYSDPSEALVSTTAANGWVIFDADLYQGGQISATNPAEDVSGYLISPPVDFSSSSSVILEFQQVFRYCCADDKPFVLEVSNDGGSTWIVYDAAPTFTGGANDASANPLLTTVDISAAAAGESFVIFRFGWQPNGNSTHSHYYWGIDDIRAYENPVQNDLRVLQVTNGDILNDYEYRCLALEQAIDPTQGGLVIGTMYENIGTITQNATITAEVLDATQATVLATVTETVFAFSNAESPTPGDQIDTVFLQTQWAPAEAGTYFVRTTLSYNGTDETPTDNTVTKKFLVVDGEYGHDDPTMINSEMAPFIGTGTAADPYASTGYGSYLTCFNPGSTAGGLSIRFDNNTDDYCPFNILLLARNTDYNLSDADYVAYAEYEVQPFYVPTGASQQFPIYLAFDDAVQLTEGTTYFAGIQTEFATEQELAVKAIDEVDSDFSTGYWAETTTAGEFLWFFGVGFLTDATPAIRLVLNEFVGVEEEASYINDFAISPNPASTNAQIRFDLKAASYIAYEVRDIQGKLIEFNNIGLHSQGANSFNLNVSEYAAGNYIFNLVVEGEKMFSRQFNVTR
jgi:Secretion system C-terminal sorting domain